jgi:hypothetical protein
MEKFSKSESSLPLPHLPAQLLRQKAFPVAENHLLVNANNSRAVKSAIEKQKYFCVVK